MDPTLFQHAGDGAAGFRDALGVLHPVHPGPARIVSLVPSVTECLIHLGLAEQVVARTNFCIHPQAAVSTIPRVGGTKTPDLERILALAPTHVVLNVDENREGDATALAQRGVTVVTTHPIDPADNLTLYRVLGGIFDVRDRASALAVDFVDAYTALTRRTAGALERRVLYLIWRNPWMTVSRDTYISKMLELAGLHTVTPPCTPDGAINGATDGNRYPVLEMTAQGIGEVDLILLSSEPFPFKGRHRDEIRAALGAHCPAIHHIDGEMTSWYGSRAAPACRYLADFVAGLDDGMPAT